MGVSAFLAICSIVACGGLWMASRPTRSPQQSKKTGRTTHYVGDDILVVRLSDKPVTREASQGGNTHISYAADDSIVEIVVLDASASGALPVQVLSGPWYEADDGPLTAKQLAALRKDAAEHFPKGKLISSESLFK